MRPVLTAKAMQQIDKATIEGLGLPGAALMETAGRAVAAEIDRFELTSDCIRPLVLCGRGNNGGDGFVVARLLIERSDKGWPQVFLTGKLSELTGDAASMARVATGCGVRVVELESETGLGRLEKALGEADLVVDALLGSGAKGAPRSLTGRIIELVQSCTHPLVAIDSPSGVQMDDGQIPGAALTADLTVTFGYLKIGHLIQPGRSYCGELVTADIGFPEAAEKNVDFDIFLTEPADVGFNFGPRPEDTHKGDYGKVLVLGGSTGLTGAPVMAAESALAVGAGMVTAGVPASLNPIFETKLTEVMSSPLADNGRGALAKAALDSVLDIMEREMDVLALGPGLGREKESRDLVLALVGKLGCPTVIDADGLNAFEGHAGRLKGLRAPLVLTPHPGEMSRLTGFSVEEIKSHPLAVARDFAVSHGLVLVLKGNPSLAADRSGQVVINPTGGPALAKAGSGDVLTGVIAGLLAQGLDPFSAAWCGMYLHGLAGDIAAARLGEYSVTATDLIAALPAAIKAVEEEVFGEE